MTTSLNPYISKFDAGFDVEKSSQYRLTIQFSLGGFSYALLDLDSNMIIGMEYYPLDAQVDSAEVFDAMERVLDSKGLNNKPFQSVTCLIDDRIYSFVPTEFFDEKEAAAYLDFSFQISSEQVILDEKLTTEQCVNVFALPKALHAKITSKWANANITHASTVFANSLVEYAPEGKVVFVNVRNRDFDMVILNEGKLLFYNNFKFNTKADFAYFLLFALEQNQISALEVPVCFSGLILPNSEIIDLCSRYVKNLLFIEDRHVVQVSKVLEDVPYQYYHLHYQSLR